MIPVLVKIGLAEKYMFFKGCNNLVQIYRSFAITGNYGRRSFSKYGISYVNIHASNRQIWYRHTNSEAGNDEIQNFQRESKHGFLFCGNYILKYW
jgi:hypothetical protein